VNRNFLGVKVCGCARSHPAIPSYRLEEIFTRGEEIIYRTKTSGFRGTARRNRKTHRSGGSSISVNRGFDDSGIRAWSTEQSQIAQLARDDRQQFAGVTSANHIGEIARSMFPSLGAIARNADGFPFARSGASHWSAKIQRRSRSIGQEGVLVVKSVQYGARHHSTCLVETMPLALELHGEIQDRIGKAGTQRRVWSAGIIMR